MKRPSPLTALVTGANRGIGIEVCGQLARRGMEVILTGRDADHVAAAAGELRNDGLQVDSKTWRARVPRVASDVGAGDGPRSWAPDQPEAVTRSLHSPVRCTAFRSIAARTAPELHPPQPSPEGRRVQVVAGGEELHHRRVR